MLWHLHVWYTLCHPVSSKLKWLEMKTIYRIASNQSHLKDKTLHNWSSTMTYCNRFECTCLVLCPRRNSIDFSAFVYTGSAKCICSDVLRILLNVRGTWNIGKRCETAVSYFSVTNRHQICQNINRNLLLKKTGKNNE